MESECDGTPAASAKARAKVKAKFKAKFKVEFKVEFKAKFKAKMKAKRVDKGRMVRLADDLRRRVGPSVVVTDFGDESS